MTESAAILNAPRHRTTLSSGILRSDWMELRFLPGFGCHWARLRLPIKGEWFDFLKPVTSGDTLLDAPTGHGSYILAPWSNRIPEGRFSFEGKNYTLRPNFPDGSAIHGDVRVRPWKVVTSTSSLFEATLDTTGFEDFNYPFALCFRHRMEARGDRLQVEMTVENTDRVRVPVGQGYHPFILRRLSWRDDDLIFAGRRHRTTGAELRQ